MARIEKFSDLDAWKQARILTNRVYDSMWECRDYGFRDQITRASVSIMNNIAEWFWRTSHKERVRFLDIALGSLNEVQSMIHLALDRRIISENIFQEILDLTNQTMNLIYGFSRYIKQYASQESEHNP